MNSVRTRQHLARVLHAAERLVTANCDEPEVRERFIKLVREHGDVRRSDHRLQYRALVEQLEDDPQLAHRYAALIAGAPLPLQDVSAKRGAK